MSGNMAPILASAIGELHGNFSGVSQIYKNKIFEGILIYNFINFRFINHVMLLLRKLT